MTLYCIKETIQYSEIVSLARCKIKNTQMLQGIEQISFYSFAFASECGILDVSQKMLKNFKSLQCAIQPDASSDNAFAYWKEVICKRLCATLVSTRPDDGFAYWKEVIWKTKQEFRAKYSFPKTSLADHKVDDDINIHSPKIVMEYIDAVVGNLNVLVKINDPSSLLFVPGPNEQIEQVLKELKLLRFFVCFVSNKCIEPQYRLTTFYTHALIEASHIAMVVWLHFPIYGNGNQDLNPGDVSRLLSDFMEMKIKSIEPGISRNNIYIDVLRALKSTIPQAQKKHAAESGIVETPTHNLMVGLSDQMANLQEMLCLLRDNLIHLPILDLEFHLQDMDSVIVDAGLLIYLFYDIKGQMEDTTLEVINRALGFNLPRNIEPIKAMVTLSWKRHFNLTCQGISKAVIQIHSLSSRINFKLFKRNLRACNLSSRLLSRPEPTPWAGPARRLTTDSGVLSWINGVLDADPGYLRLHHHKMQANWHQYIECTSMRVRELNHNLSLKGVQRNSYLGSVQLMNNQTQYKAIRHMQYI
uniref:Late blight resistance protein, putative n=1 Tax=Solanum demissum TaxID=50514 RepID=Q6L405_SOLDE|nr:Late blight resistance protein, putative [Solanum demissum]